MRLSITIESRQSVIMTDELESSVPLAKRNGRSSAQQV